MDNKNIALLLGLILGSIIIAGLLLNIIGYVKIWLMFIIFILIFGLFYRYFIGTKTRIERYEAYLLIAVISISIIMIAIRRYPFSDFWWYHQKNWFIVNYLLDVGKIISWIPYWYLGYPLLQLYAPGSHILSIFFTKIFGIGIFYGEIIVNLLTYFLLILALNMFLSRHVSSKISFLTASLVAISPRLFNEIFIQGHYPNLLSLAFGLIGLSFLEKSSQKENEKKDAILFSLFMFLSLITHFSFFTILLIATILTFMFLRRFKEYKTMAKFGIPIAIAAFWLLPAIVESGYWHGNVPGPNPFIIYILSFGPFLLLIIYGLYLMHRERMGYVLAFTSALFIMSLVPLLLFPILPEGLTNLLQKIFVDTFKSTITTSILMILPLTLAVNHIIKNAKYRKIGVTLLALFIMFSLFLDYVYVRQDAVKVIRFNGEHYKDDSYSRLYINNYDNIKKELEDKNMIYGMDGMIAARLFNVYSAYGPPIPAPKKNLELDDKEYRESLIDNGVRYYFVDGKEDLVDYRLIDAVGFYQAKEYNINSGYLLDIIKEGKVINYMINPEDFPSRKYDKGLSIYWAKEAGKLIDDSINDTSYAISFLGKPLELSNKITWQINNTGIKIFTRNKEDNQLKVKINYSPHWKAFADGRRIKIEKTEQDTMILDVPANAKKVELIWGYSIADYIGMAISLLAIAGLLIFAFRQRA